MFVLTKIDPMVGIFAYIFFVFARYLFFNLKVICFLRHLVNSIEFVEDICYYLCVKVRVLLLMM